jgi:F-type H+-transporting ATPase subunit gamma
VESELFAERPVRTVGVLLISSDRGLCGAYNTNTFARFHALERELGKDVKLELFVIGRKAYSYLHRRGYQITRYFSDPPLEKMDFAVARMVGKTLVDAYVAGAVDQVRIVHTSFETAARFEPKVKDFLPLSQVPTGLDASEVETRHNIDYLLEPTAEMLFDRLLPRYLETVVYDAMLSSLASEYASRRMAMKGATDAASRMGKELKRVYNRARQESITKELLDIIGGASAVA